LNKAEAVSDDVRGGLVDLLLEALRATLGEMAGTEVSVLGLRQTSFQDQLDALNAVVPITSSSFRTLILSFPQDTALGLAKRILPEPEKIDETLVQDCVAEIANVVAGQAKALLAGTPYQFTFSLPRIVEGAYPPPFEQGEIVLVIALRCDQGEFSLGIVLVPFLGK
jgi:chemotaxis protein CheX